MLDRFKLPGDPNLPPGCTAADIDRGCLPDGEMHCCVCNEVCPESDDDMCDTCREDHSAD